MRTKERKFLFGLPSWVLALLTALFTVIFLLLLGFLLSSIFQLGDWTAYVSYAIIVAIACFFICKNNPKSFWYVPILCNVFGIISALIEPNFWITSMWIYICGGWVLSLIGAVSGAKVGKRSITNASQTIKEL